MNDSKENCVKRSSLDGEAYDVIVGGAGSAGIAAACSAARAGARTLLLERYGFGGGILTAAMIHTFDAITSCRDHDVTVVGGIARKILSEIDALGGLATGDNPPEALVIHPEIYKVAIDRLLSSAGVSVLYHAHICGALSEGGTVRGVEACLRDGRARFHAQTVIDATGDAEIAFYAGAPFQIAPNLQALTCHFRLGCVAPGLTWRDYETLTRAALAEAHAAGELQAFGGPWVIRLGGDEISINATRVFGNPVDPRQLSEAEQVGRAEMLRIWTILRRRVPELGGSSLISGASQLHIRESRIIEGEYVLTEHDIKAGAHFADSIAVGAWPVDIHPADGAIGVHPHKENPPPPYEIPFRCLLPRECKGLLVAGKPISTTHRAHGSTRGPGTSLATGQAAGVAAALASRQGCRADQLDPQDLRSALLSQGAIISAHVDPSSP